MTKDLSKLSSAKPCEDRAEAVELLQELCSGRRLSNVYGTGNPMLVSDIPSSCANTKTGVILGIDEAGRGPVLGPMTYGCAYWHPDDSSHIPKGFTDSKQLSANNRSSLFSKIESCQHMGFVLHVLHASEISRNMLRADPYNLNAMSHDSAMQMIQAVLDAGVTIDTAYIDTVGLPDSYRRKLEQEFNQGQGHDIKFVVEKKADANYAPCSAASVVAKVSRDSIIDQWTYSEEKFGLLDCDAKYGSGYPSDPACKAWMERNARVDPVFMFPDFVRFSWAPSRKAVEDFGAKVEWQAEVEDEKEDASQMKMNAFLHSVTKRGKGGESHSIAPTKKRRRCDYFERVKLTAVTELVKSRCISEQV